MKTNTTFARESDGEAHRRAHVVEEHEERPADREDAAVAGHADHRRPHAVLANAVVDLPAAGRLGCLLGSVGQLRSGVAGEVGGAGHQSGERVDAGGEHLADRLPRRPPSRPARTSAARLPNRRSRCRAHAASHAARSSGSAASSVLLPPLVVAGATLGGDLAVGGRRRRAASRTARRGCRGSPSSRVTSSAVNGLPWASWWSVHFGDGVPTCERRMSRLGRSSTALAASSASSRASQSSAISPRYSTCQP